MWGRKSVGFTSAILLLADLHFVKLKTNKSPEKENLTSVAAIYSSCYSVGNKKTVHLFQSLPSFAVSVLETQVINFKFS